MELACQVVPDIPTFAVDDGFTYAIPEGMTVSVGSIVRVRVSGRRRRGFVTAIFPRPDGRRLLDVDGVSGSAPTFDEHLLESARRVAEHYVAPLSNVLGRTVPPNVPRRSRRSTAPVRSTEPGPVMVTGSWAPHHRAVMDALERSGPRPIVVPTDVEAQALADALATAEEPVGRVLTASSAQSNAATTAAWVSASQDTDTVMVGTRETMLWASAAKRGWIVVEDGRRVMKSPATPTLQVRDVLLERLRNEGGTLDVIGPVPTLEVMAVADVTTIPPGRSWSPVEIVDRTEEPPGSSLLTHRVRHGIASTARDADRVFVLVTARGYAPAYRCRGCGSLRRCGRCQAAAEPSGTCPRCGTDTATCSSCGTGPMAPLGAGIGRLVDDIRRFVDPADVGTAEDGRTVVVGSERDLVGLEDVALGVVVDVDGMIGAPNYRAAEDTVRLVARLGQAIRSRAGRVIVQTSDPAHPVVHTLASGHPQRFLEGEMAARRRAGFPPIGRLLAVEVASHDVDDADRRLRTAVGTGGTVLGPAHIQGRTRWLIQGDDLRAARLALRSVVGALRGEGARVRVDADPIDL